MKFHFIAIFFLLLCSSLFAEELFIQTFIDENCTILADNPRIFILEKCTYLYESYYAKYTKTEDDKILYSFCKDKECETDCNDFGVYEMNECQSYAENTFILFTNFTKLENSIIAQHYQGEDCNEENSAMKVVHYDGMCFPTSDEYFAKMTWKNGKIERSFVCSDSNCSVDCVTLTYENDTCVNEGENSIKYIALCESYPEIPEKLVKHTFTNDKCEFSNEPLEYWDIGECTIVEGGEYQVVKYENGKLVEYSGCDSKCESCKHSMDLEYAKCKVISPNLSIMYTEAPETIPTGQVLGKVYLGDSCEGPRSADILFVEDICWNKTGSYITFQCDEIDSIRALYCNNNNCSDCIARRIHHNQCLEYKNGMSYTLRGCVVIRTQIAVYSYNKNDCVDQHVPARVFKVDKCLQYGELSSKWEMFTTGGILIHHYRNEDCSGEPPTSFEFDFDMCTNVGPTSTFIDDVPPIDDNVVIEKVYAGGDCSGSEVFTILYHLRDCYEGDIDSSVQYACRHGVLYRYDECNTPQSAKKVDFDACEQRGNFHFKVVGKCPNVPTQIAKYEFDGPDCGISVEPAFIIPTQTCFYNPKAKKYQFIDFEGDEIEYKQCSDENCKTCTSSMHSFYQCYQEGSSSFYFTESIPDGTGEEDVIKKIWYGQECQGEAVISQVHNGTCYSTPTGSTKMVCLNGKILRAECKDKNCEVDCNYIILETVCNSHDDHSFAYSGNCVTASQVVLKEYTTPDCKPPLELPIMAETNECIKKGDKEYFKIDYDPLYGNITYITQCSDEECKLNCFTRSIPKRNQCNPDGQKSILFEQHIDEYEQNAFVSQIFDSEGNRLYKNLFVGECVKVDEATFTKYECIEGVRKTFECIDSSCNNCKPVDLKDEVGARPVKYSCALPVEEIALMKFEDEGCQKQTSPTIIMQTNTCVKSTEGYDEVYYDIDGRVHVYTKCNDPECYVGCVEDERFTKYDCTAKRYFDDPPLETDSSIITKKYYGQDCKSHYGDIHYKIGVCYEDGDAYTSVQCSNGKIEMKTCIDPKCSEQCSSTFIEPKECKNLNTGYSIIPYGCMAVPPKIGWTEFNNSECQPTDAIRAAPLVYFTNRCLEYHGMSVKVEMVSTNNIVFKRCQGSGCSEDCTVLEKFRKDICTQSSAENDTWIRMVDAPTPPGKGVYVLHKYLMDATCDPEGESAYAIYEDGKCYETLSNRLIFEKFVCEDGNLYKYIYKDAQECISSTSHMEKTLLEFNKCYQSKNVYEMIEGYCKSEDSPEIEEDLSYIAYNAQSVTINGRGFSENPEDNDLTLDNEGTVFKCKILSATSHVIVCELDRELVAGALFAELFVKGRGYADKTQIARVDATPPIKGNAKIIPIGVPSDSKSQSITDQLFVQWDDFEDEESGIDYYEVRLDEQDEWKNVRKENSYILKDLSLEFGKSYSAQVRAVNYVGLKSIPAITEEIRISKEIEFRIRANETTIANFVTKNFTLKMEIPADSIIEDMQFEYQTVEEESDAEKPDEILARAIGFILKRKGSDEQILFAKPVKLEIDFSKAAHLVKGTPKLYLKYFDVQKSFWKFVQDECDIEESTNYETMVHSTAICHCTQFALFNTSKPNITSLVLTILLVVVGMSIGTILIIVSIHMVNKSRRKAVFMRRTEELGDLTERMLQHDEVQRVREMDNEYEPPQFTGNETEENVEDQ